MISPLTTTKSPSIGVVLCPEPPLTPFAAARPFAYVGADTVPFLRGHVTASNPAAGKPLASADLVNVPRLVTAYFARKPDPADPTQRVASAPRAIAARR